MIHLSSTLLLVGFLGGESSFELFDDVGVHVLVDLDGQEDDDQYEHPEGSPLTSAGAGERCG